MAEPYSTSFFDKISDTAQSSSEVVARWLCGLAKPDSLVDVGCALGDWALAFREQDVTFVQGIDGDYVDQSSLKIPQENFVTADLEDPFSLGRSFDLAVCLEVAEHLSIAGADLLVSSIANHADAVLFSAAVPYQDGTNHLNEQWPRYWHEKFATHHFDLFDVVRPIFWHDQRVSIWYRQNMMLFLRGTNGYAGSLRDTLAGFSTFHGQPIVHPELWMNRINGASYSVGKFAGPTARIRGFSRSVVRAISRRTGK